MTRSRAIVVAAAFVVGALGIWLLQDGGASGADGVDPSDPSADDLESMMHVEGEPPADVSAGGSATTGLAGAATAPASGPVTVTVLTADGAPAAGVTVGVGPPPAMRNVDTSGRAMFENVPYDGTAVASVAIRPYYDTTVVRSSVPIRGPELEIRIDELPAVEIRFEDAGTGAGVNVGDLALRPERLLTDPQVPERGTVRFALANAASTWSNVRVAGTVPDGYVVLDDARGFGFKRSPYAHTLIGVVPVHRELRLDVLIKNHEGGPCPEAVIDRVVVAGKDHHAPKVEADGFGNRRVSGLPSFRRERVNVHAVIPGTTSEAWVGAWIPIEDDAVTLSITMPKPEPIDDSFNGAIGLGGGAGGSFKSRSGRRRGPTPQGRVRLRVRRWNGEPAAHARVSVGGKSAETDENGVATLVNVAPGTHAVSVKQYGLIPIAGEIVVTDTATAELELKEPVGARLEVQVVDDLDQPLPYAVVRLLGKSGISGGKRLIDWPLVVGGVQRIDPYVDDEGRRTYERLPTDIESIEVTWGSRTFVESPVDLADGETKRIKVRLAARSGAPK